jgi:hypothetical protein
MILILTDNMIAECPRADCNRLWDKIKFSLLNYIILGKHMRLVKMVDELAVF